MMNDDEYDPSFSLLSLAPVWGLLISPISQCLFPFIAVYKKCMQGRDVFDGLSSNSCSCFFFQTHFVFASRNC